MTELEAKYPDITIIRKKETVSTNYDGRAMCEELENPVVIIADRQSGGRGRQGKTFHSPEGGLYMTAVIPCGLPISESIGVTSCTAVCVSRAIERLTGAECGIKWVNDIYLNGGKLAGILVESVNNYEKMISDYLIIGIGVNLIESPHVSDSSVHAVSLRDAGFSADRDELAGEIISEILAMRAGRFDFSSYADEYARRSVVLGREITFVKNGTRYTGHAENITRTGGLSVRCGTDIITLDSGEISLRINTQQSQFIKTDGNQSDII